MKTLIARTCTLLGLAVTAPATADAWQQHIVEGTPPGRRYFHTAVWTGSEMIVWGGLDGNFLNTGGRYNPVTNRWTAVTTTGAPTPRIHHTAVWTGNEMIVWGGSYYDGTSGRFFNDGARYNPAEDTWTAVNTIGAPAARGGHTVVWTGSEMIVWGGYNGPSSFNNDTFSYTPDCEDFRIISAVFDSGNLTLEFPTMTGRIYTLWTSDTLAAGTWIETGLPALTGTGATQTFTVPATIPARRFFRVQSDP